MQCLLSSMLHPIARLAFGNTSNKRQSVYLSSSGPLYGWRYIMRLAKNKTHYNVCVNIVISDIWVCMLIKHNAMFMYITGNMTDMI